MINGIVYDFESVKVNMPNGSVRTITDITYSQKKDVDVVTDSRGVPVGMVRKAYEGDASLTMSLGEYEAFAASAGPGGVLGMDPFPIIISFANAGTAPIVDTIVVKLTEVPREAKKDSEVVMKLTGKQMQVAKLNGRPVYTPLI